MSSAEFKVPVLAFEASVLLLDGTKREGRIFLPADAQAHTGPMLPAERFNDPTAFFPFMPKGEESTELLNKQHVCCVTLERGESEIEHALPHRRVRLECKSASFEGTLALDTPVTQLRVLDHLNAVPQFLVLHENGEEHLVNKQAIVRVLEVGE